MPHLTLDYSANLEALCDVSKLCDHLRLAAISTGVLPLAGVRVRAFCATHVSIADGAEDNIYLDISVRLRAGRDIETRKAATKLIFEAAQEFLAPVIATHPIALSMEMRDIDPDLAPKLNTIRDHLKKD
ncbi:MAG: 5-carboxymethyl-2-hydroxymuconate isomerase [Rhodobacterales bacterium]|nr:5-carboxymethyl-2-hydroxymuconate isomerase [Rhodobacterales bacterium]